MNINTNNLEDDTDHLESPAAKLVAMFAKRLEIDRIRRHKLWELEEDREKIKEELHSPKPAKLKWNEEPVQVCVYTPLMSNETSMCESVASRGSRGKIFQEMESIGENMDKDDVELIEEVELDENDVELDVVDQIDQGDDASQQELDPVEEMDQDEPDEPLETLSEKPSDVNQSALPPHLQFLANIPLPKSLPPLPVVQIPQIPSDIPSIPDISDVPNDHEEELSKIPEIKTEIIPVEIAHAMSPELLHGSPMIGYTIDDVEDEIKVTIVEEIADQMVENDENAPPVQETTPITSSSTLEHCPTPVKAPRTPRQTPSPSLKQTERIYALEKTQKALLQTIQQQRMVQKTYQTELLRISQERNSLYEMVQTMRQELVALLNATSK